MDSFYDARTETYIPIHIPINKLIDDNDNDNDSETNERVIWEFTLGIPFENTFENEIQKQNFENAVFEITEEITKITHGLTYEYCHGTWKKENMSMNMNMNANINLDTHDTIERDLSVRISVIVLPEMSVTVYNLTKNIILKVNKKYDLGLIHVQAMKTLGSARNFLSF